MLKLFAGDKVALMTLSVSALLICAPVAYAGPESDQPDQEEKQQQEQEQEEQAIGSRIANEIAGQAQKAGQGMGQQGQPGNNPDNLDLSHVNCYMLDGVPHMGYNGEVLYGSHDFGPPCWTVFDLKPHL